MSKEQSAGAARVANIINTFGCLPSVNPSTTIPQFDPMQLSRAIAASLNESRMYGHTKITLHLDLPDAHALAQFLRKAGK